MKSSQAGFTLIEVVVAVSLSSMVLIAVVSVSTSIIREHMDAIRKGTVTGWSLVSFTQMSREIENANVLVSPAAAGSSNLLVLCNNWSRLLAASPICGGGDLRLNCAATAPVEVIYYCYNPAEKVIWRYYNSGLALTCPAAVPAVACDGSPAFPQKLQVAINVEPLEPANLPLFTRSAIGELTIRFAVGEQQATVNRQNPISRPFDATFVLQKALLNNTD
jgi:prepilin-type N-terminal cleavage/methylation domain-containing protein